MPYKIETMTQPNRLLVRDVIDPRRFALRNHRFTDEERAAFKARNDAQTPEEKIKDLFIETWYSNFRATDVYHWCEANTPGYTVSRGNNNNAIIQFANRQHAMFFKLVWA